jgi:hypothetical protein
VGKSSRILSMVTAFLCLGAASAGDLPTLRFDMGAADSPVAPGFIQVTERTIFDEQLGYGWKSPGHESFDVKRPAENPDWLGPAGQRIPGDYLIYKEHTPLTRDGVRSGEDLVFRAQVPDGVYRLALTLGDLERPIHSLQIIVNDKLMAQDIDAKHVKSRATADVLYGFPRSLRLTVEVMGGKGVTVRIRGDDSLFKKRFLQEFEKPAPISYLTGNPFGIKKADRPDLSKWGLERDGSRIGEVWVWEDIGGPFTVNSLMALEIYPFTAPPLWWQSGSLTVTSGDGRLEKAVQLFNQKKFELSEKAFDVVKDDYSRALGYLWLAGRPEYEEERRLVPKALRILEDISDRERGDLIFEEVLENARRMKKAIYRFENRAKLQRTYTELLLISGEVASMQPEDPTYYKGLIYAGRGFFMVIPHRWTYSAGVGRQLFQKVREGGFGDNRFVRWYLDGVWREHKPEWIYKDYSEKKKGAPEWAANVFEAYNRELDLAEWWIENRQAEDGSLGGGWGDDVEILRSLAAFGSICPDASPLTLEGTRKVANGAWNSGSIDQEAGYFAEVGDTEHSGEWTADTLVPMIHIDFGDPLYIERALKTGKLMRDLWMDFNPKGHFLVRSNHLGATGIGTPIQANDSRINYRPLAPARAVYWYNGLPSLEKLFLRWADSWLAASMSTERGKPKGIIPQEIAFPDSLIGGVQSPSWYEAYRGPGTVNYSWEGSRGYHDAIVDLLLLAHQATGDRKYLEPMELQAEFARRYCPPELLASRAHGRPGPFFETRLTPGSNEWVGANLRNWPDQWTKIQAVMFPDEVPDQQRLWSLEEAAEMTAQEAKGARERWPHVTTECIATDRVYWPGMGNALKVMTASGLAGRYLQASYHGLGRDFAAVVQRATASSLRIVLYSFSDEEKEVALVPWILQPGANYSFRGGPAAGPDRVLQDAVVQRQLTLVFQGQEISFVMPPRVEYVIELERQGPISPRRLAADLAIGKEDVVFVPHFHRIDVTVHNIGSEAARGVVVALETAGEELGRVLIPHIAAPVNLETQTVRVSFPVKPTGDRQEFTVRLDPEDTITEITDRNNQVSVELELPVTPRRRHSDP